MNAKVISACIRILVPAALYTGLETNKVFSSTRDELVSFRQLS